MPKVPPARPALSVTSVNVPLPVVPVERVRERDARAEEVARAAVDEVDVHPAVAVVVEERGARRPSSREGSGRGRARCRGPSDPALLGRHLAEEPRARGGADRARSRRGARPRAPARRRRRAPPTPVPIVEASSSFLSSASKRRWYPLGRTRRVGVRSRFFASVVECEDSRSDPAAEPRLATSGNVSAWRTVDRATTGPGCRRRSPWRWRWRRPRRPPRRRARSATPSTVSRTSSFRPASSRWAACRATTAAPRTARTRARATP